ncbi:hypothetical protein QUE_0425 [Clostridioides difficile P51]|nr:hypothetical protein QUE_0425 [Clostridioides difficile P51]
MNKITIIIKYIHKNFKFMDFYLTLLSIYIYNKKLSQI